MLSDLESGNSECRTVAAEGLRSNLRGNTPLNGKLLPWMVESLGDSRLASWVERFGSPLNLQCHETFANNLTRLRSAGRQYGNDFEVYFARKANKCIEYVETCVANQAGVDTASLEELQQALDAGMPGSRLICTAAIKEAPLLSVCLEHGVTVALDNHDELRLLRSIASAAGLKPWVALRVGGFRHQETRLTTRFGFTIDEAAAIANCYGSDQLSIDGVHFHLDGYDPEQRVSGIDQSLALIDEIRRAGHPAAFLDMGGGFPISYLESRHQWEAFWRSHRHSLLGQQPAATYRGHTLGLTIDNDRLLGKPNVYPFYQELVSDAWLESILSSKLASGRTIATEIARRSVQLRCEPGRALLEGCGMTIARVVHRRRNESGDLLIGLAMNRTQCRTGSDDFLIDPILIPVSAGDGSRQSEPGQGYLTGAYCTESEAILLRRLVFPIGVAVGDLVALPNTAGYFMHFLECRSHQFPLAKNVFIESVT